MVKRYSIRGLGRERRCYRNAELSEIALLDRFDYSLDVRRAHDEIQRRLEKGEISEKAAQSLRGKSRIESVYGQDGRLISKGTAQQGSEGEVTERGPPTKLIPTEKTGNTGTAETEAGLEVAFYYALVPSDKIIASHDFETLAKNPDYPAWLQPRSRENAAYRLQVNKGIIGENTNQL